VGERLPWYEVKIAQHFICSHDRTMTMPLADQARQNLLKRASTDLRFGAPLFGTFAEDLTGATLGVPGFELRWLVFQVTGNCFKVVQATSTSNLLQRWTNVVDLDSGTLTGWVRAPRCPLHGLVNGAQSAASADLAMEEETVRGLPTWLREREAVTASYWAGTASFSSTSADLCGLTRCHVRGRLGKE
jgi:hypothetical protein